MSIEQKTAFVVSQRGWLVLLCVWAVSLGYMGGHLMRGWVPHDEGGMAQSAERVLAGEIPHRDFDEPYTGGLSYLDAAAFRVLGANLATLRVVLFAVFALWVPTIFYMASRLFSIYVAATVTLLAVVWSVPNYAAAVPSWYNLFWGCFGTAALFRYIEVNRRRWLLLAGVCGGISIVIKFAGLYFVACVLLFLIFREQQLSDERDSAPSSRSLPCTGAVVAGLTLFAFAVLSLALSNPEATRGLFYFALPSLAVAILLVYRELSGVQGGTLERTASLLSMGVPFGIGVALPVSIFLVSYVRTRSLYELYQGVFVRPATRFAFASMAPPRPGEVTSLLAVVLLVIVAARYRSRLWRALSGTLAVGGFSAILALSPSSPQVYRFAWHSLATAVPLIVLTGAVVLAVPRLSQALFPARRQQLMLLIAATALMSLVEVPFAAPIYFCYVMPVTILAATAVAASLMESPPRFVLGTLMAFYLIFAVWRFTPGFLSRMGFLYGPDTQIRELGLPRAGGLRVDPTDARVYEKLIPLIQEHANGRYIYAGPDCPEVYFLSGLHNPTRMIYDFLDPEGSTRTQRILDVLDAHDVNVIAINTAPSFSGRMQLDLETTLEQRYPHLAAVGRFRVRWRR